MSTFTFQDKEKRFILTAKKTFLSVCPNPEEEIIYNLITKYKLNTFLHNLEGPSIVRTDDGSQSFWVDGITIDNYVNDGDEPVKFNEYMKNAKEGI